MVGKIITLSFVCFSLLFISFPVLAGHIGVTEKKIEKLENPKKRIVRKTTILPSRSVILRKARDYDKPTTPLLVMISKDFSETKEGTFPF